MHLLYIQRYGQLRPGVLKGTQPMTDSNGKKNSPSDLGLAAIERAQARERADGLAHPYGDRSFAKMLADAKQTIATGEPVPRRTTH